MVPKLVVVSGPSGVGKTTVCERLLRLPGFERVVTATTRKPRGGERDKTDYLFLSDEEFGRWVAEDRFLEWAGVHGHRYGSPRSQAEEILARGHHALLNIDVQGAAQIRAGGTPCVLVILLPPSLGELERRLRSRGTDGPDAIETRLRAAREELERKDEFDLQVLNDDPARAADEIAAAVTARGTNRD